jgi:bifunctional DNase/RNase
MVLQLSMDQARMLAVEMRGLATDHCSLHHLVLAVTKSLGAEVSGVLIKGVDYGQVTGAIRMEYEDRILDVNVDVAAALAVALHLGLPIFMDSLYMLREDRLEPIAAPNEVANNVPIPEVFREIIETLELPASLEEEEREGREM